LKRIIAILLLSVYVTSATELYQLFKAPALVTHYIEHRKQAAGLSFWNFLCMHYGGVDVKDADFDKDMKLPFKSRDNCPNPGAFVFLLPQGSLPELPAARPAYGAPRKFTASDDHFVNAAHLSAVWQPPRAA
jgi:hypothetical protein